MPLELPSEVPAPASAATPTEIVMHTTSFDRITAINSSIVRRSTPRADGQTIAANDRGDSATRMYTSTDRTNSSTQSTTSP